MKILYFGGQKSGKSVLAEKKALELSERKPYYIATYNNNYNDKEMQKKIDKHQKQRENNFINIEKSQRLDMIIENNQTYIIDCISMWLLNNIEEDMQNLFNELEVICSKDNNIVFVLNDVNSGIIPIDKLSRDYVDKTGIMGQKLVSLCNEVYEVKFGLSKRLK